MLRVAAARADHADKQRRIDGCALQPAHVCPVCNVPRCPHSGVLHNLTATALPKVAPPHRYVLIEANSWQEAAKVCQAVLKVKVDCGIQVALGHGGRFCEDRAVALDAAKARQYAAALVDRVLVLQHVRAVAAETQNALVPWSLHGGNTTMLHSACNQMRRAIDAYGLAAMAVHDSTNDLVLPSSTTLFVTNTAHGLPPGFAAVASQRSTATRTRADLANEVETTCGSVVVLNYPRRVTEPPFPDNVFASQHIFVTIQKGAEARAHFVT